MYVYSCVSGYEVFLKADWSTGLVTTNKIMMYKSTTHLFIKFANMIVIMLICMFCGYLGNNCSFSLKPFLVDDNVQEDVGYISEVSTHDDLAYKCAISAIRSIKAFTLILTKQTKSYLVCDSKQKRNLI